MKDLYFISGLGADERVFANLKPEGFRLHFIRWQKPFKNEGIEAYAARLSAEINTPSPVLVGLSFGGIMAVEIAKIVAVDAVILISSAKTSAEIPWYYKLAGAVRLNRIIPAGWLKRWGAVTEWFFGMEHPEYRAILKKMLQDTDSDFLVWAIDKVINWKNKTTPSGVYHIHGTSDRLLPFAFTRPDASIRGGSHFMILDRAEEITALVQQRLSGC